MENEDSITRTPRKLFSYVKEFCESISIKEPLYLTVSASDSDVERECINNVRRRIESHGGNLILGWKVWEWTGIMLEAEFHAVWQMPSRRLQDVTPHKPVGDQSLLVEDPKLIYQEKQIDNIRVSLIPDERVERFIQLAQERFQILNRGKRADQYEISLSQGEIIQLQAIKRESLKIVLEIQSSVPGRNYICRCGSGKKYKKCHGLS